MSLVGMTREEIREALGDRPDAKMRAAQIAQAIYGRAVRELDDIRELPKDLRAELACGLPLSSERESRGRTLNSRADGLGGFPTAREDAGVLRSPDAEASDAVPGGELRMTPSEGADCRNSERARAGSGFIINPLQIAAHRKSSDGVDKLLVHNGDHQVFECVLLPYDDRVSCCISSQVGCPMGCRFCATGLGGFDRNLTAGEIVGQYLLLQSLTERRISHVVFMGMGEPLLNLPNVLKALKLLHEEVGLSNRHLTVSTVGIVPQIKALAKEKLPIHLALSLHSPIDEIRDRLMPVNQKWPVAEVMSAMKQYQKATGRKITIEYLLIKNLTDTPEQARALASLVKGTPSVVNLIPFNWVDTEQGFARPERERVKAFRKVLESRGVNVTERMERGHDIAAACGQLAGEHSGKFARRAGTSALPVLAS